MAKVREGLEKRKRDREQNQGWFESRFNVSPWLTALLSALAGPLLLLLLVLTIGPCVVNRLIAFVQKRVNTTQLLALQTQHRLMDEREL